MKISYFLGILVQQWIVHAAKWNSTGGHHTDRIDEPRTPEPTAETKIPAWYYLPLAVGILALTTFVVVLYINGKRRAEKRRRRRAERPQMNISVPAEGAMSSLMRNAVVDVMAVNACTTGKPQLKAKILQTFNEERSLNDSFDDNYDDNNSGYEICGVEDYTNTKGTLEDYINTKGLDYGQNSCALASQPNFKGYQNMNTKVTTGGFESGALKKTPFIPPAISMELVRKQSEIDSQIERGNISRVHGALLPDWGCRKEEQVYENQNSASVRAARSFDNFRSQKAEQQPLYGNNTHASVMKREKSGENVCRNQEMPKLPLKQKLRRTDGLGAQTKTWEKGRNPDYENFLGDDCGGGTWHEGAMHPKHTNKGYVIGQGTKASRDLKDAVDYENAPAFGGKLLHQKAQMMSASCGSQPKATLLESRRRGAGFAREDRKAVRRSRSNDEPMYSSGGGHGQNAVESKDSVCSENHQTNTESLMQLLGLPVNISCSDHVETALDDDDSYYIQMDDYDDVRA